MRLQLHSEDSTIRNGCAATQTAIACYADSLLRSRTDDHYLRTGDIYMILTSDIDITFRLNIKDDSFEPGVVRVHMPAPINAEMLHEGQILDFDPIFRMASVENYPQRSVWFDETLEKNMEFSVRYAFTNEVKCITPDIEKMNAEAQPGYTAEQIQRYENNRDCDCGSYLGELADRVSVMDLAEEAGISRQGAEETLCRLFADDIRKPDRDAAPDHIIPLNKCIDISHIPYGTRLRRIFEYCRDIETIDNAAPWTRNLELVRLLRAAGIPARWQGGIDCRPQNALIYQGPPISSDWVLIHALPYGWFYADAEAAHSAMSEARQDATDEDICIYRSTASKAEFYFGGIDPYRMPTAAKFKAGLYPAKEFTRADEYTNVRGEAELFVRGLSAEEFDTLVEVTATDGTGTDFLC